MILAHIQMASTSTTDIFSIVAQVKMKQIRNNNWGIPYCSQVVLYILEFNIWTNEKKGKSHNESRKPRQLAHTQKKTILSEVSTKYLNLFSKQSFLVDMKR